MHPPSRSGTFARSLVFAVSWWLVGFATGPSAVADDDDERAETLGQATERLSSVLRTFPASPTIQSAIDGLSQSDSHASLQEALAPVTLLVASINPESRVKLASTRDRLVVDMGQPQRFLVRIENTAGVTAPLGIAAIDLAQDPPAAAKWCQVRIVDSPMMSNVCTGAAVEYKVVEMLARQPGLREVRLVADVGQGTQDLGFRASADLLIETTPGPNDQTISNQTISNQTIFDQTISDLPISDQPPAGLGVPRQPLLAQVHRLGEALDAAGHPLDDATDAKLRALTFSADDDHVARTVQELLDRRCVAIVDVASSGPPRVRLGPAEAELIQQGWRTFLVKVINRPGRTGRLLIESPNARPLPHSPAAEVESRWMQVSSLDGQPMRANLSGLGLEYRIVQIYGRDAGQKRAVLEFTVSGGTETDGEVVRRWQFDQDRGSDGWQAIQECELAATDGSLQFTSEGDDPIITADVQARGGPMVFRFWAKSADRGFAELFWGTTDRPQMAGDRHAGFMMENDTERMYEVPFVVDGTLDGLRFDPLARPGKMRIDWIELFAANRPANWAGLDVDFTCRPATKVVLRVRDVDGKAGFAKFLIRDAAGRIYPAPSKRLAPDFFFQPHVYRGDGEHVWLPPDEYTIVCSRGPESIPETKTLVVGRQRTELVYHVDRWIDPARSGWWSGDHHIHAAGCQHYENPTQGVQPGDMIRHIMGEDLKVGCCLTWGPCFDFQKRFFTGQVAEQSVYPYTLRYDVEVSGFGSHMSGHLNLLGLTNQIYPGGQSKDHWPTLGLNTLRWAKRQGAVCGPAHSAIGLTRHVGRLAGTEGKDGPRGLPNFNIPAFDGIGANEFIVDVTHQVPGPDRRPTAAVDFISAMNTDRVAEWNMWYHVLNSGFRVAVSGETDFPCISGDRVGMGRTYARVDGQLTFEKWVRSVARGRSYVSDGQCHLLDFSAAHVASGVTVDVGRQGSEVRAASGDRVTFRVRAAARIDGQPNLPIELVVNGYPVQSESIRADRSVREVTFSTELTQSSWVAIRAFPAAHTNPIYVVVDGKPVRGSVDSIRWCLAGVDQCWKSKQPTYADAEQADAEAAYQHARDVFSERIAQSQD